MSELKKNKKKTLKIHILNGLTYNSNSVSSGNPIQMYSLSIEKKIIWIDRVVFGEYWCNYRNYW